MIPLARTSDPHTSHAASARVEEFQARHCALILAALKSAPSGLTKDEMAEVTRLDATQIARRSKDGAGLWRIGPETRPSNTGRACRVWFAL